MSGAGAGRGWGRGGAALGAGLRGALTAQQRGAWPGEEVSGTCKDFFIQSLIKVYLKPILVTRHTERLKQ